MTVILSEKFGLYQIEIGQEEATGLFFCDIDYLDEDGSNFGHWSDNQPHPTVQEVLETALLRLAKLLSQDLGHNAEIKAPSIEGDRAGNGIRTHDILLGNFSLSVKHSQIRKDYTAAYGELRAGLGYFDGSIAGEHISEEIVELAGRSYDHRTQRFIGWLSLERRETFLLKSPRPIQLWWPSKSEVQS